LLGDAASGGHGALLMRITELVMRIINKAFKENRDGKGEGFPE